MCILRAIHKEKNVYIRKIKRSLTTNKIVCVDYDKHRRDDSSYAHAMLIKYRALNRDFNRVARSHIKGSPKKKKVVLIFIIRIQNQMVAL